MPTHEPTDADARVALTAQLDAACRELDQLPHAISHDVRAPLRAVEGFARMLEHRAAAKLDAEELRLLEVVHTSCRRMNELVDELTAHLRLARQPLQCVPVDMQALANEAWQSLPQRGDARLELSDLPAAVADRSLLRRVWSELLDNAVKFSSSQAQPLVTVGAEREGDALVYSVRDNGVGFDPKLADRLFHIFQRLHPASAFAGNGMGLADVACIVARHGGRYGARSEPARGATFWFALPASN